MRRLVLSLPALALALALLPTAPRTGAAVAGAAANAAEGGKICIRVGEYVVCYRTGDPGTPVEA